MTLAAPSTRQGMFSLALAIVVALAAVVGGLFWYNSASADISTTTVSLTDDAGASINPGASITYTATVTQVGVPGGVTTNARFTVTLDAANILSATFPAANDADIFPWMAFQCTYTPGTGVAECNEPPGAMGSDIVTIVAVVKAGGDNVVAAPTACFVSDDGIGQADCVQTGIAAVAVTGISGPADASNLVGVNHTFTWTLPGGFTCASDVNNDVTRDCAAGDVVLSANTSGSAFVGGVTVSSTVLASSSTVSVTITGPAAGSVTVTLNARFEGDIATDTDDVNGLSDAAVKTYNTLATAGGGFILRHVDVDCATERANGSGGSDYGSNGLQCNGLLSNGNVFTGDFTVSGFALDDNDDATGSLHTVCILGNVTSADNANLDWTITPTPGSAATVNNLQKVGLDVSGNGNLEPCVQWRSAGVGGQTITATYVPTGEVIYSNGSQSLDGSCPGDGTPTACEPLIKQWNDIDVTSIINVTGNVGNTLAANTDELIVDSDRDCTDSGFCARANWDGTTVEITGAEFAPSGEILAGGKSFIDYTFGDHDNYAGPVDGVEQTYSVSGNCGSVRLEDPVTGNVIILYPGDSATILNSDKGVGFQLLPTDDGDVDTDFFNADCEDGDSLTVSISSKEDVQLRSDLDTAPDEEVTVRWVHGPGQNKQPQLAWAGMRVVLEHNWSQPDGTCLWNELPRELASIGVRYAIQHPSPGFLSPVPFSPAIATGPDYLIVPLGEDCVSRVIYESQEPGEVDVTAHIVAFDFNLQDGGTAVANGLSLDPSLIVVLSEEYDFLVYYMKLEDVTLTASATESIVSSDVTLTTMVRGWLLLPSGGNCPQRAETVDSHGGVLPANRCIFPDDWDFLGGPNPEIDAPNLDIWGGSSGGCSGSAQGPFSLLDGPGCGDTLAPRAGGVFRDANFPDGDVNDLDAPMPPAEVRYDIDLHGTGDDSGFLHAADSTKTPWDRANIPAEPWILTAGSGYRWDSFGGGSNNGPYDFWEIADHDSEVISCPGASPCPGVGVPTGGYKRIYVYSDNHGEARALINGDADLDFQDCFDNADTTPINVAGEGDIKQINGFFCELGDVVGISSVDVSVNYPDKQGKHYPLVAGPVEITWTWGGIKQITVEQTAGDQFSYVILHVTDRDGFCGNSPSLHPVLGERVDWLLDSGDGTIVDGEILISIGILGQSATTETFDPDSGGVRPAPGPRIDEDECQTWIQVVSTLLNEVNVLITAHDPEGRVIFDVKLNVDGDNDGVRDADDNCPTTYNPDQADNNGFEDGAGAGDACEVIPTPTPNTATDLWGDVDCDSDVDSADAMKVLQTVVGIPISQTGPCHAMGDSITVNGTARKFGDWNCDGNVTSADALAILRYIVSSPLAPGGGCPVVGVLVDIS